MSSNTNSPGFVNLAMQIFYKALVTFCGLFFFLEARSQDFFSGIDPATIKYYMQADGLPSEKISRTVQDERGFLWIATYEGLSRFDGKNFTNFFQSNNKNSISSSIIYDMELFENNKLALATSSGINLFDVISNEVKTFWYRGDDRYFGFHNTFNFITKDRKGRIWAGSRTGLFMLNEKLELQKQWLDSVNEDVLKTKLLYVATSATWVNGQLIFSYKNEFRFYNENTGELELYKPFQGRNYYLFEKAGYNPSPQLRRVNANMIISHNIVTGSSDTVKIPMEKGEHLARSYLLNDSVILLSTYSNLIRFYSLTSRTFHDIRLPINYDNVHPEVAVQDVFVDKDDNVWLSTMNFLAKIPRGKTAIKSYRSEYFPGNTFPLLLVNSFLVRDTIWYVGTYGNGLFRINPNNNSSRHFDFNTHASYEFLNSIWAIRSHSKDTLWISTQSGLLWFHEKNFTSGFVNYPGMPSILTGDRIICTQFEDSKGIIWMGIGFGNGLVTYNKGTGEWYHCNTKEPGCPLPLRHITAIDEDENGDLWMGTQRGGGLIKWSRKTNSFSLITAQPESDFRQDNIEFIYSDKRGHIWIAVGSYGIVRHDIRTGNFKFFNRSSGLCSNNATSCILIGDYLWISTISGISCLNTIDESVINFTSADGLSGKSIETLYFDSLSGNLFCGGAASFDVFNPVALLKQEKEKPVFITSISLFDNYQPLNSGKSIELTHDNNFLRFNFSEVNFSGNVLSRFEYKLEDLDEKWIKGGSDGYASYSGIPPGEYLFKVRKEGSVSNASTDSYRIIILPPFWKTWWFRLLLLVFIAGCIYWIVVRRVRMIRREEKQKTEFHKQLAEVEMKALRAQMNPHFIFNCLNSINKFILENDTEKATKYLSKFSKLIRMILENSEQPMITLQSEMEMLEAYLEMEANRFKTRFEYRIHVDEKISMNNVEIPSMLIQPYVENAIWHGLLPKEGKGILKISVSENGRGLLCVIEDNGVGREKAKELKENKILAQKSMGMKVTEERMQLLSVTRSRKPGVKISDLKKNGIASGTKVELTIPLGTE